MEIDNRYEEDDTNVYHQRKPSYGRLNERTCSESSIECVDPDFKPSTRRGWDSAKYIIFVEVGERFSFYGVALNLIMYLTQVLEMPMGVAAKHVNTWMGSSAILTLIGAFVADSYLGRFKTIIISSILYLIGSTVLTLSTFAIPVNHREAFFFAGIYMIAFAQGGHKPCVQIFAADQFSEDEKEDKGSFFNLWYVGVITGGLSSMIIVIYVQDNISWAIGYGIITAAVAAALILFLVGIPKYRQETPVGSNFSRLAQVFVAAAWKWCVSVSTSNAKLCYDDEAHLVGIKPLAQTNMFRCLDRAAMIDDVDASRKTRNNWRLCSVNQVEEVKLVLSLFPIWCSGMIFALVASQQNTFFIKQGSTMITSIGPNFSIPPAWLTIITCITIISTVLMYERIFVPIARRYTKRPSGITIIQRIGIGLIFLTLGVIMAALVEGKRIRVAEEHGLLEKPQERVPISIIWLIPQYLLSGMADSFAMVGMQEIFYDQMPEKMRSIGAAGFISSLGFGSIASSITIAIVQVVTANNGDKWLGDNINTAHLDKFYWFLAVLSSLSICIYAWATKDFVYKKNEESQ